MGGADAQLLLQCRIELPDVESGGTRGIREYHCAYIVAIEGIAINSFAFIHNNGRPETAATFLKADLTAVGLGADLRHRRRIAPALLDFRDTYNATWLVERHGFRPPEAIRREQLQPAALAA